MSKRIYFYTLKLLSYMEKILSLILFVQKRIITKRANFNRQTDVNIQNPLFIHIEGLMMNDDKILWTYH